MLVSLFFRFTLLLEAGLFGLCGFLISPGYGAEMQFHSDWVSLGDSGSEYAPFSVGYLGGRLHLLLSRPGGVIEHLSLSASRPTPVSVARFSSETLPLASCSRGLLEASHGVMLLCGPALRRILLQDDGSIHELSALTIGMPVAKRYFKRFAVRHLSDGRVLVAAVDSWRIAIWERDARTEDFNLAYSMRVPWGGRAVEWLDPSIVESSGSLHMLFAARVPSSDQSISLFKSRFLHLFRKKTDSTWRAKAVDHIPDTPNNILSEARFATGGRRLYLVYVLDSSLYIQSAAERSNWSRPVKSGACTPNHLQVFSGRAAALFWVDDCFQEHEWWVRLPFSTLIPKGRGNWLNNDVMTLVLGAAVAGGKPVRVTSELSFTDQMAVVALDASTFFVLRSGRKKVGYQLDSYNYSNEYFFRWGNMSIQGADYQLNKQTCTLPVCMSSGEYDDKPR